ncbi:MAG: polyphosphate kinase 1 [Bacteroidota bacterium]
MSKRPIKNRDINWLYFNERVLLEAANPTTPLLERLKFLAIFSSNLDEYFKVRVSQLRQLKSVDKNLRKKLISKPNKTLKFILKKVDEQQNRFGKIIRQTLLELREEGLVLNNRADLQPSEKTHLADWFQEIAQDCTILKSKSTENFKDGRIYLITQFSDVDFEIVTVPTDLHPRFVKISDDWNSYIFLEDVVKMNLNHLFPNKKVIGCFAIKVSRDADLYLDDDYTDTDLVDVIYRSLGKRNTGQPTRVLYDSNLPDSLKNVLKETLDLDDLDMIPGGEHHNYSDFFSFPNPFSDNRLSYQPMPPLAHPILTDNDSIFETIFQKDQLVHFPYQEFGMVENFIQTAATDPNVTRIKMSLYRIAKTSVLSDAILLALKNKKEVVLFVEAQARFDEENNIKWGRVFEKNGAKVFFSVPQIKVHSKILMVEREDENGPQRFAYIGTGNFNAKTAKLYCDHGLFTAHKRITADLAQVFAVLERKLIAPKLKHLLVSPFTTRATFLELIENEMEHAKEGKTAKITLKMNSLEDSKMIKTLYKASEAGVEVRLLVRGFSCLVPKEENLGEHEKPIYVTSIVDRFLEHGRIYLFENGGMEKMYIGSADWMTRNLDRRIEVLTPILDQDVFQELKDILNIQLSDNVKARILDAKDTNQKIAKQSNEPEVRSQYAIYDYLKAKLNEDRSNNRST